MTNRLLTATLAAAGLGLAVAPSFAQVQAGAPEQAIPETEGDVSTRLTAAIRAEIGDRATTATTEDLEGYIMFVVSQREYSASVINSALDTLETGADGNLKQAVSNVRLALLRKKVNRGTAAIANSGGVFGTNGFSTPSLNLGSGSSNYTQ